LLGLAFIAGLFALVRYYPYWPLYGHSGPLPAATVEESTMAARLLEHVRAVASVPHNTDHPEALEAAARYIERRLEALGYAVERQEFEAHGHKVRNIHVAIGEAGGGRSTFVVGAHYDSDGIAPGANDNGSGVAALLELAGLLKGYQPRRHLLRLVFFVNEEMPHFGTETMGSRQFARMITAREAVRGMISLETIGAFSDEPGSQAFPFPLGLVYRDRADFIAFVGTPRARGLVHEVLGSFRRHTQFPTIGGVAHAFIKGIAWSDHASFDEQDVPALMITDTALFRYRHYHRPSDTPDKVDYGRLARITKGVERTLREIVD
jgi:hypothetical protein